VRLLRPKAAPPFVERGSLNSHLSQRRQTVTLLSYTQAMMIVEKVTAFNVMARGNEVQA